MNSELSADERSNIQYEYSTILSSYHSYFAVAAKGISIYLLIIGASLSLPYTLRLGEPAQLHFRELCKWFAISVSFVSVIAYYIGSCFFVKMHKRAQELADSLGFMRPHTLLLPIIIRMACVLAIVVAILIGISG